MKLTLSSSRRNFLKTAGSVTVGVAGMAALADTISNSVSKEKEAGGLFTREIADVKDRMERVKVAALGMQRYDWEQGVVAQALLEIGEIDLAIAFARGAIVRQEKGRFSVLKGNGPITDCSSIGEVVLFAGKQTGDPIFQRGADEMLAVIRTTGHKTAEGIIYHTQEPNREIWSDATYMLPPFLAAAGQFAEAVKQIEGYRKYLYNEKERLYSHMWNDEK